jgi:hypothetical protein
MTATILKAYQTGRDSAYFEAVRKTIIYSDAAQEMGWNKKNEDRESQFAGSAEVVDNQHGVPHWLRKYAAKMAPAVEEEEERSEEEEEEEVEVDHDAKAMLRKLAELDLEVKAAKGSAHDGCAAAARGRTKKHTKHQNSDDMLHEKTENSHGVDAAWGEVC